ncbi:MAG: hypothetical protein F6K58_27405 [Symploca sp. SIO2E9]|nr:hypothetical protein [Symploca sp. SIO2E9]
MGRGGDGEMGRGGDGEMGRWGEGEMNFLPSASCLLPPAFPGEMGRLNTLNL